MSLSSRLLAFGRPSPNSLDGNRYTFVLLVTQCIRWIKLTKPTNKVSYQSALTFPFKGWICCVQVVLICLSQKEFNPSIFAYFLPLRLNPPDLAG